MFRVTTLLFFLFLAPIVVSQEEEEEQEQQYLYAENAGVVIDYMPSPSTGDPVRPDFLYSPYNGPRMVEFYAVRVISPRVQSLSVAMVCCFISSSIL